MMSLCEKITIKLLDAGSPPLNEAERGHLDRCPHCREVAEDAQVVGQSLEALAQAANAAPEARLPRELKDGVRTQLRAASERETAAPAAEWLARLLAPLRFAITPKLAWAAAALLLVGAVGAGLWFNRPAPPVGALDFASHPADLRINATAIKIATPGENQPLRAGDAVETGERTRAIFSHGKSVRGALAEKTKVDIATANRLKLHYGSVWLRVEASAANSPRQYQVDSPHGSIQVKGTSFGVTVGEDETRIEVAKGAVLVAQAGRKVAAGQLLVLKSGKLESPSARPLKNNLPPWVKDVLAQWNAASAGRYVPSLWENGQ